MELVQEYAGRVLVLHDGKLEGDGPVKTIMKDMDVLKKAHVLPAQIPMLALRFGDRFANVYTVEEMADAIARERGTCRNQEGRCGGMNLLNYVPGDSFLHRLNPVTKLAAAFPLRRGLHCHGQRVDGTSVDRPDASDLLLCRARETGSVSDEKPAGAWRDHVSFCSFSLCVPGNRCWLSAAFAYLPQAASTARCF